MRYSFRSDRRGFTLIELLIVLAVISIVAVIGIPSFIGYLHHTTDMTCRNTAEQLLTEAERSIAVRQFVDAGDVAEHFIALLDRSSTTEVSVGHTEEISHASYQTINGERYIASWSISDTYMTVSFTCAEHDTECKRKIRVFYIDTTVCK